MAYIRGALFGLYLGAITIFAGVIGLPAPFIGEKPARRVIQLWAKGVLAGLRIICGVSYRIEGAENLPDGPAIVAANHQSMWETIVFFALLPHPVAVFKSELLRIPIYGWWGQRAGSIPIDRSAGVRSIRKLKRLTGNALAEGAQIVVFPEGTRVPVGERAPFQPGVAAIYLASNVDCVPAAHDSGRFWLHPGIAKRPGVITLRIMPPIPSGLDRASFLKSLRDRIEEARPDLAASPPDAVTTRSRAAVG